MARIRIRFSKLGKIRWTSHRDVARMWERAFRRIQLPLAWSAGFSPRPKVSFGLALPTGHESLAEYLDVELVATPAADDVLADLAGLPGRLSAALPQGVDAVAAALLPAGSASLQEVVTSCTWQWTAVAADDNKRVAPSDLRAWAERFLASPSVTVTRTRKGAEVTDDIRTAVLDLQVIGAAGPGPNDGVRLEAELACRPRSLRPSELLAGLGPGLEERDTRRLHQWILRAGARTEPIPVLSGSAGAPHALERAS